MLSVDFYLDASNFTNGCYITQTQDGIKKFLVYNSFTLLPVEQNYDTYKQNLAATVIFTKKYSHIPNADQQSIIHTNHKPVLEFINAKYQDSIFAPWVNKLQLFHIHIQQILETKNTLANTLFQIIFNNTNCTSAHLVHKLIKQVYLYQDDNEWFWKLDIGDYGRILI